MSERTSRPFTIYYGLHRFYFLSIRIAFALARASGRMFYQIRNLAVIVDSLLSGLLYLSIASTPWLLLSPARRRLSTLLPLLAAHVLFLWLLREERKEALRNTFRPFSIYDMDIGSAKVLRGTVTVANLFVVARDEEWTAEGIARVVEKVERAASWLEGQAARFDVDVKIESEVLPDRGTWSRRTIPEWKNDYEHLDQFHRMVESAVGPERLSRFRSAADGGRNVCLLVHVLGPIRSYAVPDFLGKKREGGSLEYAVTASRDSPSAYAHELLHLFGANDYYSEYSKATQRMKAEFLAGSIMFYGGHLPLERLVVDGLTAQNIGWL